MKKITLLLVEDEAIIAMVTKAALEKSGYEVYHAVSGEKAIDMVGQLSIDLVLMDIDLGKGIDGIETARRIPETPTVFLSSHSEPEFVEKTEQVAAYGYVLKSSPISILTASIRMALKLCATRSLADTAFNQALSGAALHRMIYDEATGLYDCEYIAVNTAFTTETGVKQSDVAGKTIRDLYPDPEIASSVIDLYRKAIAREIPSKQEIYFAGNEQWFSLDIVPTESNEFIVFINNTTEYRQLENQHKLIFETMPSGIVFHNKDKSILSVNPAAERLLGLTSDQMKGKTPFDPRWRMVTPDGLTVPGDKHPAIIALETGKKFGPVDRGVYIPEKDEYVWLSITAIPLYRPGAAEPYMSYAIFDNITERLQFEKETHERKTYLQVTLNSIGDAVVMTDLEGQIVHMNPVAEKLCGYSLYSVMGKVFSEHFDIKSSKRGY